MPKKDRQKKLIETLQMIETEMDNTSIVLKIKSYVIEVRKKSPRIVGQTYYRFSKSGDDDYIEKKLVARDEDDERLIEAFLTSRRMVRFAPRVDDPSSVLEVWA